MVHDMKIKYFATYRDITRRREEDVAAANAPDVWALLAELGGRYGAPLKNKLYSADGSDINEETIILVNGRNVFHLNGKDTPLADSDVVSVFPVVAGG